MLKLYSEQLQTQLNNEGLRAAYILMGNDPLLLQESQVMIRQIAATKGFNEYHSIKIDKNTDWREMFSFCQTISLFSSRKIIMLTLPENGFDKVINEQLDKIIKLLHDDILLILHVDKLTKAHKNNTWLIRLDAQAILVLCHTPEHEQLPKWVAARARRYNLQLDESACQLLCYCYEGNLLALKQVLDQLSIMWPNDRLTLTRIEQIVNDVAYFTPLKWIDALLAAEIKRALHILQQLYLEGSEPIMLLRTLQRELILLVNLKRQSATTPLNLLFNKYHVWRNRWNMITKAINRLDYNQLRQSVHILVMAELTLKQGYNKSIWTKLESISVLLCHNVLAEIFIHI